MTQQDTKSLRLKKEDTDRKYFGVFICWVFHWFWVYLYAFLGLYNRKRFIGGGFEPETPLNMLMLMTETKVEKKDPRGWPTPLGGINSSLKEIYIFSLKGFRFVGMCTGGTGVRMAKPDLPGGESPGSDSGEVRGRLGDRTPGIPQGLSKARFAHVLFRNWA